ncbi:TonB-dependent siderophore receptor [Rhodopseudomonas palustris HaA2]|uniref:TonB-dependent siderophore receptor n=1 Tax=Rhodopseudomonas palustris (strain HaA2) TaxID=316058 RepID=Q2IS80_RHOP2|nr:TonB-dependent siderophore receptor [Rhodopseudomonas palustris]ABD08930.1 TonB-dependent siderophore receptor [Rhodopseudomonas palustris HaA2]
MPTARRWPILSSPRLLRSATARLLLGAAICLVSLPPSSRPAEAQGVAPAAGAELPSVTVDAPAARPARPRSVAAPQRNPQAVARRPNPQRNPAPAPPTPSERAAAAAAVLNEQKLGYRAMPSPTTLRTGASPLESSQSVNVVPEQVLKDQLPRNLDDALANVSGVTQTNTLAGSFDAVIRRGFGDNRDGSIMRNGMPLVQGRALGATVESVEVLKGPASLLYGIQTPGGIVNTISRRPELYQHGSLTLLGSSFGGGKNGANAIFDLTGPIGDTGLAYRFIGSGLDEDYWRNFGANREMLLAPSLAWYGERTTVQFSYEHREFSYPFDRGTSFVNGAPLAIPATRRLDEAFNRTWGKSDLVQGSVEHRLDDVWKLTAAYSYNSETYDANQLRITGVNAATGVETRSNDGTKGALAYSSYGTSYLSGELWLGGLRNDVLIGGDAQRRVIYRQNLIRQSTPSFNFYNPVYGLVQPGTTVSASDSDQTDKLETRSLFVQDTLHLTDWFSLVGGLRWMEYDQLAGRGRPFTANTDLAGSKVLPLAGAIFKLNQQVSLYASYTQSLQPSSTIAPLTGGVVIGSNIAPEEGTQYEAGVKFDLNKRLSGTLAVYDIDKKNVLVSQFNASTGLNEYRAAGKVRSRGVEFDVTGRLDDHWSTIASYGYTDAYVTEDPTLVGKRLQNVAMNTASLFLVYDFGTALPGRLRLGGGARYVGDRPGDSTNSFVLPAYTVADVFASYEVKHAGIPVIYQLNVKNLFDQVYYPSAVNTLNVALGDARRFSLSATAKF